MADVGPLAGAGASSSPSPGAATGVDGGADGAELEDVAAPGVVLLVESDADDALGLRAASASACMRSIASSRAS